MKLCNGKQFQVVVWSDLIIFGAKMAQPPRKNFPVHLLSLDNDGRSLKAERSRTNNCTTSTFSVLYFCIHVYFVFVQSCYDCNNVLLSL